MPKAQLMSPLQGSRSFSSLPTAARWAKISAALPALEHSRKRDTARPRKVRSALLKLHNCPIFKLPNPIYQGPRLASRCNLYDSCASTGTNRKNRLKCPGPLFSSHTGTASIEYEVQHDDERNPNAKCGQPTARGKWAGNSSFRDRRNVCVGLLRKSG